MSRVSPCDTSGLFGARMISHPQPRNTIAIPLVTMSDKGSMSLTAVRLRNQIAGKGNACRKEPFKGMGLTVVIDPRRDHIGMWNLGTTSEHIILCDQISSRRISGKLPSCEKSLNP